MPQKKNNKHKKKSTHSTPDTQDLKSLLESLSESDFTQTGATTKLVLLLTKNEYRAALTSDEETVSLVQYFIKRAYTNNLGSVEKSFHSRNYILTLAASASTRKLQNSWCHCFIGISRARTHYLVSKINKSAKTAESIQRKWLDHALALQQEKFLLHAVPTTVLLEGLYAYSICYQYNFGQTAYLSEVICKRAFILLRSISETFVCNMQVITQEDLPVSTIQKTLNTLVYAPYVFFLREWKGTAVEIPQGVTAVKLSEHAQYAVTMLSRIGALLEIILSKVMTGEDKQQLDSKTANDGVWQRMKATSYYARSIPGKPFVNKKTLEYLHKQIQEIDVQDKQNFLRYLFYLKAFANAQMSVYQPFARQYKDQNFMSSLESVYTQEMTRAMPVHQHVDRSTAASVELLAEEILRAQQRGEKQKLRTQKSRAASSKLEEEPEEAESDNSDGDETIAVATQAPTTKPLDMAKFMTPKERVASDLAGISSIARTDIVSACNALFDKLCTIVLPTNLVAKSYCYQKGTAGVVTLYDHVDYVMQLRYTNSEGETLIPWKKLLSSSFEHGAAINVLDDLDFETVYTYMLYCIELAFLESQAGKRFVKQNNYNDAITHFWFAIDCASHVDLMLHYHEFMIREKGYIAPELLDMLQQLALELKVEYDKVSQKQYRYFQKLSESRERARQSPFWINNPRYLSCGPSRKTQQYHAAKAQVQQEDPWLAQLTLDRLVARFSGDETSAQAAWKEKPPGLPAPAAGPLSPTSQVFTVTIGSIPKQLRKHDAKPDGNCGFYSLKLDRKQTVDRLLQALRDPMAQKPLCVAIAPEIVDALLAGDLNKHQNIHELAQIRVDSYSTFTLGIQQRIAHIKTLLKTLDSQQNEKIAPMNNEQLINWLIGQQFATQPQFYPLQTAQQGLMEFYQINQQAHKNLLQFALRPEIVQRFLESYSSQDQWLSFVRPFDQKESNERVVSSVAAGGASIIPNEPIGLLGAMVVADIVPGICIWQQNSTLSQLELIYSCGDSKHQNAKHLLYNGYNHFDGLL